MTSQPLQVVIGTSVGPFVIGSSTHHVLGLIKTDPASFPAIQVKYSPVEPLLHPLIVELPANGLRLNFDGAEQRLRFIEVLDFSKVLLQHNDNAINKPRGEGLLQESRANAGPDFQRIYREFGPANPGEFIGEDGQEGIYCMSFKEGIAFSFPVKAPEGFSKIDLAKVIAVLGSSACLPATSMVIFRGRSWPLARKDIYSADLSNMFLSPLAAIRREGIPAEVEAAKVQDRGRIELMRRGAPSFFLRLGETTQQDLLIELGPPDTIYRKVNRQSTAAQRRTSSMSSRRPNLNHLDSDRTSSATSETDGSDAWSDEDESEELTVVNEFDNPDIGVWWNYYSHGLDILVSQAHQLPLQSPPNSMQPDAEKCNTENETIARNHLTVTKVCIHGNIAGSYQFNRHRRLRWTLNSWRLPLHSTSDHSSPLTSETKFRDLQSHLRTVFKNSYGSDLEEKEQQQPLAINRDWGEASSLGNSVELLGGLDIGNKRGDSNDDDGEGSRIGEVLVFGFPGLAFEVLKNGAISTLQVW